MLCLQIRVRMCVCVCVRSSSPVHTGPEPQQVQGAPMCVCLCVCMQTYLCVRVLSHRRCRVSIPHGTIVRWPHAVLLLCEHGRTLPRAPLAHVHHDTDNDAHKDSTGHCMVTATQQTQTYVACLSRRRTG